MFYLLVMGVSGFLMPIIATAETVFIQEITASQRMGRVFSIIQIFTSAAMPLAILLFGPLADVVSVETLLIISGFLLAIVGLVYQLTNRDSERPLL
ncbi:MAG TPA: hypothetical protein PLH60_07660 [Proteiniphilum sp.]|nr:hypothetical protein [Proteiniphilum sp.]HPJ49447.1 hypothetical protein [Proteiniphilum sp.]HPR20414.1 hypothetical protein [Proteiniphilum sp.]